MFIEFLSVDSQCKMLYLLLHYRYKIGRSKWCLVSRFGVSLEYDEIMWNAWLRQAHTYDGYSIENGNKLKSKCKCISEHIKTTLNFVDSSAQFLIAVKCCSTPAVVIVSDMWIKNSTTMLVFVHFVPPNFLLFRFDLCRPQVKYAPLQFSLLVPCNYSRTIKLKTK